MPLTYTNYLKVDELLSLQVPKSDPAEHDETLFIVVHQVYELWFKQLLHDFEFLGEQFRTNNIGRALHLLKRVKAIFRTLIQQIEVMETMTPLEFNTFRDRLESASGFQSYQFRCLEFTLGAKKKEVMERFPLESQGRKLLQQYYEAPSVWDNFLVCLVHNDYEIPEDLLQPSYARANQSHGKVESALLRVYQSDFRLTEVCEYLVDIDCAQQEWRYKHVKMVERTIGHKQGTGGSAGVDYLIQTLFKPVFIDLLSVRQKF